MEGISIRSGAGEFRDVQSFVGQYVKTGTQTTEFVGVTLSSVRKTIRLDNTGTIELVQGELKLSGGGSSTTAIEVQGDATLTLASDVSYAQPTALTGAGTINFDLGTHDFTGTQFLPAGDLNFNGGVVTIENVIAPASLGTFKGIVNFNVDHTLDSIALLGTLGGSGDLTLTGTTTLSNSQFASAKIEGTGTLIVPEGATLNAFKRTTLNRVLENFGTFNHAGGTTLSVGPKFASGQRIINRPGANFNITAGGDIFPNDVITFLNEGTFRKSGVVASTFAAGVIGGRDFALRLENTGTINLEEGELILRGGGSSMTAIDVIANTTLTLESDFTYAQPVALTGAGTISFFRGSHDFSGTQFLPSGEVNFNGATVTIENVISPASLSTFKGIVNFNVDHTFDSIALLGTLGGSGDLTLTGTSTFSNLQFSNAKIQGSGKLIVPAGATLNLFKRMTLNRVLENFGTVNHAGGTTLTVGPNFASGVRIFNRVDADFNITIGGDIFPNGVVTILNEGTFTKAGSGKTRLPAGVRSGLTFSIQLDNQGELRVLGGELEYGLPSPNVPGNVEVGQGALWDVGGSVTLTGVLSGDGTVDGDVTNSGIVRPGSEIGVLTIDGDFIQTAAGALAIQIGGRDVGTQYDQLNVSGTSAFDGELRVEVANNFFSRRRRPFYSEQLRVDQW